MPEFTTHTFDTADSPDNTTQGTVGIMPIILQVNGQPYKDEPAAKTQLSYYQNRGYLEGYQVVSFASGWALFKAA